MQTIHLSHTDKAADLARRAFPDYTGRKFVVRVNSGPMSLVSAWDEGRRDYHRIVRLADMEIVEVPENGSPFVAEVKCEQSLPAPGYVVVTRHYVGMGEYVSINVHPENVNNLALPAPTELAWAERVVLCSTRSHKSSYAGISNYRFHEARRTGITLAEWETAKAALIGRKLLNGAGAITPAGRNAIGRTDLYELNRPAELATA